MSTPAVTAANYWHILIASSTADNLSPLPFSTFVLTLFTVFFFSTEYWNIIIDPLTNKSI